jgi:energy-coupling factor transport system substrate-specific component
MTTVLGRIGDLAADNVADDDFADIAPARRVPRTHAIRLGPRSWFAIAATSIIGIAGFGWPFLATPGSTAVEHSTDAVWLFTLLLPMVLVIVITQVLDHVLDAKAIALLGVLAATGAALRPLGSGTAGFEPIWIVLILGGAALGPGFGFALGSLTMFASALLTGGVGPWLPFQMIAAAWVGFGAGCLPRLRGRGEIPVLCVYSVVACVAYGFLMNLWFWPWATGLNSALSYVPGADVNVNVGHWLVFSLATSIAWDLMRATVTVVLILVAGRPVLIALRRAVRRAAFNAAPVFDVPTGTTANTAITAITAVTAPAAAARPAVSSGDRATHERGN